MVQNVEEIQSHMSRTLRQRVQTHSHGSKTVEKWATKKCRKRWEHYLSPVPSTKRVPALGRQQDILHRGFRKAESSLALQLRTEKIGFAAFLHARRVPVVVFPGVLVRLTTSRP